MRYEPGRVRLYRDGKLVADQAIAPSGKPVSRRLAIGRLVEGGIGCTGTIEYVRLSQGVRPIHPAHGTASGRRPTIGLWQFASRAGRRSRTSRS